jgi:hypothetical protein
MTRRIEIELTSARDDNTWTWRAAGARQPKGTLDGSLLYEGAKVGDVVRAEATVDVDGITIVAVSPPKPRGDGRDEARIEVIGPPRDSSPPRVTTGPGRTRRPRGEAGRQEGRAGRDRRRPGRGEGPGRPERPAGREVAPEEPAAPPPPPRPRPKRLQPGRAHRDAVLAELPEAHRPIAEQILRGGIPAVRRAIEAENAKAAAAGRPTIKADALVALAEELAPRLRAAEWLDRAEAAARDVEEVSLRDLRSVVVAADAAARDEHARSLAATLREALERRSAAARERWLAEITAALDEGRVVRALRASARPPEPGARLPRELVERLAAAAGAALSPEVAPERWAAVLDAVAASPVARLVTPAGLPPEPGDALLAAAKEAAARVPGVARLLGVEPPAPAGGARRPPRTAPAAGAPGAGGTGPRPPAGPQQPGGAG